MDTSLSQKQQSILIAAADLFLKYGIRKTGIRDIAQKANVSQVTIYNVFGKKNDLVATLVKKITQDVDDKYKAIMASEISFKEKVNKILQVKIEAHKKGAWQIVKEAMSLDPGLQESIYQNFKKNASDNIKEIITIGRKEGVISKKLSDDAIIMYMQAITLFFSKEDSGFEKYKNNPELVEELYWIFWNGVMEK